MRRLCMLLFVTSIALASVPSAYGQEQTRGEPYEEYDSAIRLNVGSFLSGLLLGNLILAGTYEQRTDENVGINFGLGIGQTPVVSLAQIGIGVNYYFQGTALHGWYANVNSGILFGSDSRNWLVVFPAGAGAGYQWIDRSGFVVRVGAGFSFSRLFGVAPSLVTSMGWAL